MTRATLMMTAVALMSLPGGLLSDAATAQEKHRVVIKTLPENTKFTQQHAIDVGDVPGHQVRVFEIHRTYPNNPPIINGLKLVETWNRGITDYTNVNGPNYNYTVSIMENGDKYFSRTITLSQGIGAGKNSYTSVSTITGGTGKMAGMQGVSRSSGRSDLAAGINENESELEYWFVK
jgi:hypothetical protein